MAAGFLWFDNTCWGWQIHLVHAILCFLNEDISGLYAFEVTGKPRRHSVRYLARLGPYRSILRKGERM